tara:strand:- start:3204 stop:3884 length:681 start_codon:yes stop_codon:yes gene_type:complete
LIQTLAFLQQDNSSITLMLRLVVSGVLAAWLLLNQPIFAQRPFPEHDDLPLPQNFGRVFSEYHTDQSELEPEEIDSAVLNRLMQEIAQTPQQTASIIGIDEMSLAKVFISLSNAKNFVNTNEIGNIKAMCETWAFSNFQGEARVKEALDAYAASSQVTLTFIENFYDKVLDEIKSILSATERSRFDDYMNDRRRRMADAGAPSRRINLGDIKSGAETINLYCRNSR